MKDIRAGIIPLTAVVLVLALSTVARAVPKETVLHAFSTVPHGAGPGSPLIADGAGNLYGTTTQGGAYGVVFELTPGKNGTWKQTVLHDFKGSVYGGPDGAYPVSNLLLDPAGNLYGATDRGGTFGLGCVFRLTHSGSVWKETVLYSFLGAPNDASGIFGGPIGLAMDSAGNILGTAPAGGNGPCFDNSGNSIGCGVVFKLSPGAGGTWTESLLYSFQYSTDGGIPSSIVVLDSAGDVYGTTEFGGDLQCPTLQGAVGCGTVFKLTPGLDGTWTESVLYTFTGFSGDQSPYPYGSLLFDSQGNLFGTAGGEYAYGAVFELSPTSSGGWTESTLYVFNGGTDGEFLFEGLALDAPGNIYGTTVFGGSGPCSSYQSVGCGTVFELSKGQSGWSKSILYNFLDGADGAYPSAGVTLDAAGNIYTTASTGGAANCLNPNGLPTGCGAVVKLSPGSNGTLTSKVLYDFPFYDDGARPAAGLVADSLGNLYGTTASGGTHNAGTVFEVSLLPSGQWQSRVIYNFGDATSDGSSPAAGLIFDAAGNVYGTTQQRGSKRGGTVFELSPSASGSWTETILYSFLTNSAQDGSGPSASLVFDGEGKLYGTTWFGGGATACAYGCGTVFRLSPTSSGPWTETILYSFGNQLGSGVNPITSLVFDKRGNLYGTASGGSASNGVVFELSPPVSGPPWKETVLYTFQGSTDGSIPSGLIFDEAGNLYGTSYFGGVYGAGTVFEMTRNTDGSWTRAALYDFSSTNGDGGYPLAGLVFDAVGNLYGTTHSGGLTVDGGSGTVFELLRQSGGGWAEKILHRFNGYQDGGVPYGGVVLDAAGNVFGTTNQGGAGAAGVVFEVTP